MSAAMDECEEAPTREPREPPWTPVQLKAIAGYVTAGATVPNACIAAGVKWSTAKNWMERGKKGAMPYVLFREAMREAKALHRVGLKLIIMGAAKKGDWRAAAHLEAHLEGCDAHNEKLRRRRLDEPLPPDPDHEHVVLLYPVPMPPGADISQLSLPPGSVIETTATPVPKGEEDADD